MKKKIDHWKIIDEIGWGRKTVDYEAVAKEWFGKLGKEGMKGLQDFVRARATQLQGAVVQCEKDLEVTLDVGTDDTFSDVTYHIVGMGFLEWHNAVTDPRRVERRKQAKYGSFEGYKESFAYCFQEPKPSRTEEQKEFSLKTLVKRIKALEQQIGELEHQLSIARGCFKDINHLLGQVVEDSKKTS